MRRLAITISLAMSCGGAAVVLTACGGDVGNNGDLVGGPCHNGHDCVDECAKGKDFPDGTCTVSCSEDHDCPDGTACVDKEGGICLLVCHHDDECRSAYSCKSTKREGHGGDTDVCID